MKKILLKDLAEFREWQKIAVKGVDDHGQSSVIVMSPPFEYPTILIWCFIEKEEPDSRSSTVLIDVLSYKYIYLGDFPVKNIKHGTYVYQVFQTSDVADI